MRRKGRKKRKERTEKEKSCISASTADNRTPPRGVFVFVKKYLSCLAFNSSAPEILGRKLVCCRQKGKRVLREIA